MAWTDARDQIVSIIEGTTPTTKKRGLPGSFRHVAEASEDAIPDARSFWIVITKMSMKGHLSALLPRWFVYDVDLVVAYPDDTDPTLLFEAIAADHAAVMARLPDSSLWGQPTSTIESLYLGRDPVGETDIEDVDGFVLVTFHLTATFRST